MARNDKVRLKKVLIEVDAPTFVWRAAGILLGVNGIENALEYVRGTAEKRKPRQLTLRLEALTDGTTHL